MVSLDFLNYQLLLESKKDCDLTRSKTFDGIADAMAQQWTQPFYEQLTLDLNHEINNIHI